MPAGTESLEHTSSKNALNDARRDRGSFGIVLVPSKGAVRTTHFVRSQTTFDSDSPHVYRNIPDFLEGFPRFFLAHARDRYER